MKLSKILLVKAFLIVAGMFSANATLRDDASASDMNLDGEKLSEIKLARCDYDSIADKVNLNNLRNALDSY